MQTPNHSIDDLFDFSNDDDNNTVIENNVVPAALDTIPENSNDSSTLSIIESYNSPFSRAASAPHFLDELCVPRANNDLHNKKRFEEGSGGAVEELLCYVVLLEEEWRSCGGEERSGGVVMLFSTFKILKYLFVNLTKLGATWASLLGSPSSKKVITKLNFTPLETINGVFAISFMAEEFIENIKEFYAYLVGNFVGKRLDYIFIRDTLCKTWKLKGLVDVTLQNNNIFFFKFSSSEDRDRVLEMGSQFIANRFFIIRPWRPFIETEEYTLKTIPIWVNLKKVPSHLLTPHGIGKISSFIGMPLFLDKVTEDRIITSFARVCMEVGIDKDLQVSSLLLTRGLENPTLR
ncbi:hypothetical protein GIB67_002532 [Kingdonia uniflora]|uniref:DUF4283 domain-containing protein n=1 Tax=Kingdonia uniflora TaxID=39325 RepID=A0A7J7N8Q6_9MAGN|nr:hypothetical protein GIB67_002532 [Kingdonia uniflora]